MFFEAAMFCILIKTAGLSTCGLLLRFVFFAVEEAAETVAAGRVAQLAQGVVLQLSGALAADAKAIGQLLIWNALVAVPRLHHGDLALV